MPNVQRKALVPGKATPQQIAKYRRLRGQGFSQEQAAKKVGLSGAWGYKHERLEKKQIEIARENEPPPPKALHQLDGGVKDTLHDFNLFAETFLARRPVPWRLDAANRVVGWIMDRSKDTYAVLNMPPRAGKTTLFTLDIPLWLLCGGGIGDPEIGRAIRILLGHRVEKISKQYVVLMRNILDMERPFYDKEQRRDAELSFVEAFGRFRPRRTLGEYDLWRDNQFVVAQIGERAVYNKEPSVQAASQEGGFLGTRVDLSVWDDLVTSSNCRNIQVAEQTNDWWESEAEERIEPGGVNLLVGQRLGNLDLFRYQLDKMLTDGEGNQVRLYEHIIYPAHNDSTCTNTGVSDSCNQWDAKDEGCLLDAHRLNAAKLYQAMTKGRYRTVYQQEDANPEDILVHEAWIHGGEDSEGYPAEGCLDMQRGFYEWPDKPGLVNYVCVDPSVANYWAVEWWAMEPEPPHTTWLIWGARKRLLAGTDEGFLDYNPRTQQQVGLMEEIQTLSGDLGHPIQVWVVEQNAAHKYLSQTHAFGLFKQRWPQVSVLTHETQKNKGDKDWGIQALLPMRYKLGLKRLPWAKGVEVRNFVKYKITELTKWPQYATDDTVMADWFGENRRKQILQRAEVLNRRDFGRQTDILQPRYMSDGPEMPEYLEVVGG